MKKLRAGVGHTTMIVTFNDGSGRMVLAQTKSSALTFRNWSNAEPLDYLGGEDVCWAEVRGFSC